MMAEARVTPDVGAEQWILLNHARDSNQEIERLRKIGRMINRNPFL